MCACVCVSVFLYRDQSYFDSSDIVSMSWNHQKKPVNSNPKELSNPAEKADQVNPLFNANVLPAPSMVDRVD